ncbi:FAD-dependent monooxygenase [Streptomyces chartreusis]|uniref:FAD-dependent monooxygenase n=1 Tax=Streptomyces chartreusis TaxID=1969 RepID=UPI0037FC01DE
MKQASSVRPVLVVGAGPTGLTAAVELSRLGVPVRIVDRSPGPSDTSKALAVQARTIELLEPRGVGEQMVRAGQLAGGTSIYGRGRKLATVRFQHIPGRLNSLLLLPQSQTERLLAERLRRQGGEVEWGTELVSFTQDDSDPKAGVRAVLKGAQGAEEDLDAEYLISAEGAHSSVRRRLGLPFEGSSLTQRYLLADLHLDSDIPEDEMSIFLATDGFLAVFPLGKNRFRLMATDPYAEAGDADAPALHDLQRVCDHVMPVPAHVYDMSWSSRFFINSRHLSTLRVGNVFLGGDAAHVHSPAGGQGMNTGIQDMINLCWKLALVRAGQARHALLDTYQSDRLPLISKLVRTTETATKAFNSTSSLVHGLITRVAPAALSTDRVQNKATMRLSQVGASYRGGPLARGGGRHGRLRAGDRVPDADVILVSTYQSGTVTRLYELLDLGKLTLVSTDPDNDLRTLPAQLRPWRGVLAVRHIQVAADQPQLRGHDAQISADLAARPGLLLIRPDAYLAAAGDPALLADWLSTWFV